MPRIYVDLNDVTSAHDLLSYARSPVNSARLQSTLGSDTDRRMLLVSRPNLAQRRHVCTK
jgi:hypothetical protein